MLNIKLAKSKMENEEGMNHLLVNVKPEKKTSVARFEKPVAFILVIDNSGSMSSPAEKASYGSSEMRATKLDFVKTASEKLVDMMKDGDMLGVVSFSTIARLEYPLTVLSKDERFKMKDRIRNIHTMGTTNISDGLEQAAKQIDPALRKTHHIKFILLSDGEANNGITDVDGMATLVNKYRKNDISVSSIGVGLDYNSYFMENIATAAGGMFYHLEKMDQLESIFTDELETLTTLTTKNVKVSIKIPEGIFMEKNLNGFAEEVSGEVYLGNLFREQEVVFEIYTKELVKTSEAKITIRFEYDDANNSRKAVEEQVVIPLVDEEDMSDVIVNNDVVDIVKKLMEAKTKREALRSYEDGNFQTLQMDMQNSVGKLTGFAASYNINLDETFAEMQNLETSMMTRSLSKESTKALYKKSYDSSRNKK